MKRIIPIFFLVVCLQLKAQTDFPVLNLVFKYTADDNTTFQRDLTVEFRGLSNNFDAGFDEYMTDQQPSDLGLKTLEFPDQPLVKSAIEDFNQDLEVPLLLYLDKDRNVSFKATPTNLPQTNIYIRDDQEKQYYNITGSNISVGLNLTEGNYLDRFFVTFKIESLSILNGYVVNELYSFIDKNTNELVINKGNIEIQKIELYSILGQKIDNLPTSVSDSQIRYQLSKTPANILILRLQTKTGLTINKKLKVI